MLKALEKAVAIAGGQSALAKSVGVKQQHVWNWLHRDRKAPAGSVLAIEAAVRGAVTRYELRPDVFGQPPEQQRKEAA